jgi:DNA-binding transcriptional regulator YiaG
VNKTTTQFAANHGKLLLAVTLDPKEVGQRIAAARKAREWTQMAFAYEAKVSMSTVARWEAGRLPPVRELMRIADVLGVSANQLVEPPDVDETISLRLDRLEEGSAEQLELLHRVAAVLGVDLRGEPDSEQAV